MDPYLSEIPPARIALLADDATQRAHLTQTLVHQMRHDVTITCVAFEAGEALRRALRRETFDLLLLDWNVPELDGMELLQWLREQKEDRMPVLLLSSRASERDVVKALRAGADDYVVKPIRTLEICARVLRLLRPRASLAPAGQWEHFGPWVFDRSALTISVTPDVRAALGEPALRFILTDREFRLVLTLFRKAGSVVSRAYLLESAGYGSEASRLLDSHIYRLRSKLGLHLGSGVRLQTVYGQGYRLEMAASATLPDTVDQDHLDAHPPDASQGAKR